MPDAVETFNKFLVGSNGDFVTIMRPAARLTRADAILLAVWLVNVAEACPPYGDAETDFAALLKATRDEG